MIDPEALYQLDVGAVVVVTPRHGGDVRPVLGTVNRVSTSYLWVRIDGWRETLRAARSTGRGTTHSTPYQVTQATGEAIERIRRVEVTERLHGALVEVADRLKRDRIDSLVKATTTDDLVGLDRALRALLGAR